MALFVVPAMGLALAACPAEAAPFLYVANGLDNTVSVIATATNTVAAPVPVGVEPKGVAVAPNGKHAYVTNSGDGTVSVIKTATNTVAATVPVGSGPIGVAVTPDGTYVYVTNSGSSNVSIIASTSKTVVGIITVGLMPKGVCSGRATCLCGERGLQQCLGDRKGHQHGGGHGHGGDEPIWGRLYPVIQDAALKVLSKPMVLRDAPWLRRRGTEV